MLLVVRHLFDPVADALALALGPRLRSLAIESWLSGCAIRHTVGADGAATEVRTRAGQVLLDGATAALLNRVRHVPVPAFQRAAEADREYACSEAAAAFWSCLDALACPVINSVAAQRLSGRGQLPFIAAAHAAAAGLSTCTLHMTTRTRYRDVAQGSGAAPAVGAPACWCEPAGEPEGVLWIVGEQVIGALEGVAPAAARDCARRLGLGFGTLQFVRDAVGRWRWSAFDAAPLHAPPPVLAALAALLGDYEQARLQGDAA